MPQKSAADIIADAKNAYKSSGGGQHEFSDAPYSLVKPVAVAAAPTKVTPVPAPKTATVKQEAHDAGASIKSNMDNARKALAQ